MSVTNCPNKKLWPNSRVSGFSISNKNSPGMVSDTSGVWFYLGARAAVFTVWPHQPHHDVTQPRSSSRLMWCSGLLAAAADHVGPWGFLWSRTWNVCKGSFWKLIREQIKMWVSQWIESVSVHSLKPEQSPGYRLSTSTTCGKHMESVIHMLL